MLLSSHGLPSDMGQGLYDIQKNIEAFNSHNLTEFFLYLYFSIIEFLGAGLDIYHYCESSSEVLYNPIPQGVSKIQWIKVESSIFVK